MKNEKFKTSNLQFKIFSRKIWIVISLIVVFIAGCTKVSYEDVISCESPNWTSDGKVVFIIEKEVWKTEEDIGVRSEIVSDSTWLYEINSDGTGRVNKGLLFVDTPFGGAGLSSAGDWVVFGDGDSNIWVVRRDGTSLQEVGEGSYPDFSPDASQIVYEKSNQGIWIMDRDGGNDHQVISDPDAKYPAWSPDDTLIAYGYGSVHIYNLIASQQVRDFNYLYFSDWYSNGKFISVCASPEYDGGIDIDIYNDQIDTLRQISSGYYIKVSPDGNKFVSYDGSWFVINRDGSSKWYLQP